MRNKWLLYLVLFMLTANAAMVTIMLIKNKEIANEYVEIRDDHKPKFRKKTHLKFENHLANELGFDEVQLQKVKDLSSAYHINQKTYRNELFNLRKEYFQMVSQANPDSLTLHNIERRIGEIEVLKIKEEYMHYRKVRSVCSKEQAMKMDSLGRVHMQHKFRNRGSEGECRQNRSNRSQTN